MVFLLVVIGALAFGKPASAQLVSAVVSFAEGAIQLLIETFIDLYLFFVGSLLTSILIPVLVGIAQYNAFIANPIVNTGWALTRDLANILFIVVLLLIAFSTMLRIQTYHYKQALAKLIMMIILINFSKVISGVIIDFFQVLMLTFVNGFKEAMGGNFISAFHIYEMLAFAQTSAATGSSSDWAVTGALILAAIGITVVTLTILIMIVVLLYRMVMLWILVVLSPLAYFAYTVRPQYWSQWWSEFFKHLVSGPTIAFFLWLALLTAQGTDPLVNTAGINIDRTEADQEGQTLLSGFSVPSVMLNFMAMTALMIAGLIVSQKMADQSGSAVGNIAGKIRKGGMTALKYGTGAFIAKKGYDWGARRVKAYKSMKENIKNKRAGEFAQGLVNIEGKLKENTVGLAGKGLKKVYNKATGKSRREETSRDWELKKQKLAELEATGAPVEEIEKAQQEEKVAAKKAKSAKRWNQIASATIMTGGAVLGALTTGGLGAVAGVVGAGVGALAHKGAQVGLQKLADSGQDEQKAARYMQAEKVSAHRKDFQDKGVNDLKHIIDDATASEDQRMAAMIELTGRGFSDDGDIPAFREFIENHGDRYVSGIFENEVSKNNHAQAKDRDGLSKAERINLGIEKPEDWNTSALKTNIKDIINGYLDETVDVDGNTKKVFHNKKFSNSFNKMSPAQQRSVIDSAAQVVKTSNNPDEVDAAASILMISSRFDKFDENDLDEMSPKKIAGHISKDEKQFLRNVIDNPTGLTPNVVVKMKEGLPAAQFQKFWEQIKNVETGKDRTIGMSVLDHLIDKAKSKEGGLDSNDSKDNELMNEIADFAVLNGKVEHVLNTEGINDNVKEVIAEKAASSKKMRVQELSSIDFGAIDKSGVAKNFKNDILKNKKSYDIETAFNKQLIDKGNTDKIKPLIDYMKDILNKTLANQELDGLTQEQATEVKKNVLDAVYKFNSIPNSTLGKEFIDYSNKDIKDKRDELLGNPINKQNDNTQADEDIDIAEKNRKRNARRRT